MTETSRNTGSGWQKSNGSGGWTNVNTQQAQQNKSNYEQQHANSQTTAQQDKQNFNQDRSSGGYSSQNLDSEDKTGRAVRCRASATKAAITVTVDMAAEAAVGVEAAVIAGSAAFISDQRSKVDGSLHRGSNLQPVVTIPNAK